MLPNLNNVALNNNVWLSTCSNLTLASPYCAAEMTNSQIASYATGYSSYPTNVFSFHWHDACQPIGGFELVFLSHSLDHAKRSSQHSELHI